MELISHTGDDIRQSRCPTTVSPTVTGTPWCHDPSPVPWVRGLGPPVYQSDGRLECPVALKSSASRTQRLQGSLIGRRCPCVMGNCATLPVVVVMSRRRGLQPLPGLPPPCRSPPLVSGGHSHSTGHGPPCLLGACNLGLEHTVTSGQSFIGSRAPLPASSDRMRPPPGLVLGKPLPREWAPGPLHSRQRESSRMGGGWGALLAKTPSGLGAPGDSASCGGVGRLAGVLGSSPASASS